MSRYIATRAIRGANALVTEAELMLHKALSEKGAATPVAFPNTAYYLPLIYGMTGRKVETLGQLKPVVSQARSLLHPLPAAQHWTPYLGETLDGGMATLLAAETIEAIRFVYGQQPESLPGFHLAGGTAFTSPDANGSSGGNGADGHLNGPIDDIQLRSWGIQLVDGRMPGFAAIVGAAKSNEVAVKIVRELQRRNILCFLSGNVNGRSIIHQLNEEGVELGYDTYTVPFGTDTISAIYALGFAVRSALTFGGLKGGQPRDILLYNKDRVFAFVLALGEVDDLKYAAAAGAINFGFPVIADTIIPEILPTGVTTYEHVVSLPFNEIEGVDDLERAERLVQKCIEVRGVKVKVANVPVPVPYGSAFEGEVVRKANMRIEFGGKHSRAFEYLRMRPMDEVVDGKIELVGPGFENVPAQGHLDLGIVVDVAGRQMQKDFEPVLERQIHYFINGASGVQHIGQRDIAWIRVSDAAAAKGFNLEHFGKILHARFHADFGAIVDKAQVTLYTDPEMIRERLAEARVAYDYRNKRLADLTDDAVKEFYSCTLCLPEGELVVLPDGSFTPVEQLIDTVVEEKEVQVLSLKDHTLTAQPVREVFVNPSPTQLTKITLANGNTLTLTANHKLLVDTLEGLKWLPAAELAIGDYVVVSRQTNLESRHINDANDHIIDYLPDTYKVSDYDFYASLEEPLLRRYGNLAQAARSLNLNYHTLWSVFHRDSHRCFTIHEIREIVSSLGLNWDELKGRIRGLRPGLRLLETRLDEDIMYLAGLIASDGSISWRTERNATQLQFTNTEPALIARFSEIHRHLLGTEPKVYDWVAPPDAKIRGTRPVNVSYTYNPILSHLLSGLGIGQKGIDEAWQGETISRLPPRLVAAFMRGLFDGDGDVNVSDSGPRIALTTRHRREAQHIYLLLRKLGIDSTISFRSTPTPVYRVRTRGKEAFARFRDLVGSEHPDKQMKMSIELSLDRAGRRHDVVPVRCGMLLHELLERRGKEIQVNRLPIDHKTLRAWLEGQRRPSRKALERCLEGLRVLIDTTDPAYQELLAWSRSDVSVERVKDIGTIKASGERVYNFSVADTHNYLVNGVVVKNCQSFAPKHVCIISPERLGLCGAYNYLDAAASFHINPTGPNQPIKLGRQVDLSKGYWEGTNSYAKVGSHGVVEEVAMYSIMENPMTACLTADTEVIVAGRPLAIGDLVEKWPVARPEQQLLTLDEQGRLKTTRLLGVHKNPAPERLIRIQTKSGLALTLTPNHEVAVDRWQQNGHGGWARADEIQVGDHLYALRRLRLEASTPAAIDLVPDDCRVTDETLLAEVKARLKGRYGSLAKAYQTLNLSLSDQRASSIPLGVLRRLVEDLGESWVDFRRRITEVAPPSGQPRLQLPGMTPDLLYLLGLLASDGSLDRRGRYQCRVNFTNSDPTLLETYRTLYGQLFPAASLGQRSKEGGGIIAGRQVASTQASQDLYSNNFLLGLLADSLGVRTSGDQKWDLGRLVKLPEGHIAAFLAGVFDGDGSVRLRQYEGRWPVGEGYLSHSDKQAARHLQLLLKRLGIVSQVRPDGSVYKVELHGTNLRRFAQVIPTHHPAKRETLEQIAALSKEGLDKAQDQVLPYAAGKLLAGLPESQTALSPSTLFYYKTGRSRPVMDNVRQVIKEAPETAAILTPLLDNDFFLDTVTQVDEVQNDGQYTHVYNLTLLDINSYLANGVHVKNCGCFECIVMLVPEANGVMVVSREDTSMTPAGMTFSTLAGIAGGGLQTPGVMGVGKYYLISPKFISADGGFQRVVWMSSFLKESMSDELQAVAVREGDPDLIERIADERSVTTVDELLAWLEEHNHPALIMPPIF